MNVNEAINYGEEVILSAKDWTKGNASIDNQKELLMIAEHYNIKLPVCSYHFMYSSNPNDLCCTGAHKTLYKTLDRLAEAIRLTEQTIKL